MAIKHLNLISIFVILSTLILPSLAFIDSPFDWAFAPSYTRGLVCPSLRYGYCSNLATWRDSVPCSHPKSVSDPKDCYKRREWACCQAGVRDPSVVKVIVGSEADEADAKIG